MALPRAVGLSWQCGESRQDDIEAFSGRRNSTQAAIPRVRRQHIQSLQDRASQLTRKNMLVACVPELPSGAEHSPSASLLSRTGLPICSHPLHHKAFYDIRDYAMKCHVQYR